MSCARFLEKCPTWQLESVPQHLGGCQELIEEAAWYRVYDFVEALYQELEHLQELEDAEDCPFR